MDDGSSGWMMGEDGGGQDCQGHKLECKVATKRNVFEKHNKG